MLGRSDATLNRGGVRIGTAEIYRAVEALPYVDKALVVHIDLPRGAFVPLFVKTMGDAPLDATMKSTIVQQIRAQFTARHVPDDIVQAPDIPMTLTGKKLELPIKKLLLGQPPEKVLNRDSMANPASIDWYVDFARRYLERTRS